MKKILVCLSILLGYASLTLADENTWAPTVTLRSVVASKYLAFNSGGMLYNKPVIQSDLLVSFQNGFYVDLWNSTPFKRYDHNFGTEQDIGIGWAGPLSKFGLNGSVSDMTIDIGTTYFDEPGLLTFGADDVLFNHVRLSKSFKWLTVFGSFKNYIAMPDSSYRGGNLISLGACREKSFCKDRVTASTSLAIVYDTGGFGLDKGFLLYGSAELDWKLTSRLTLVLPQIDYYVPMTVRDSRTLDKVVYGGFSYRF